MKKLTIKTDEKEIIITKPKGPYTSGDYLWIGGPKEDGKYITAISKTKDLKKLKNVIISILKKRK